MTRPRWRFIVTPPAAGAENMALDEALMARSRQTGEWMLRVYSWSAPTLSLGRNQTAVGRYDLQRIHERGLDVVRRPTGGRAILHHREITYCVTGPAEDAGDLHASYVRINGLLLHALGTIGVRAAAFAPTRRASIPDLAPCFDQPSAGELTVDGRKLAGSAQWRSEGALLQHGSILVADDQSSLAELAAEPQAPIPAPATLAESLGHSPTVDELADALIGAVRLREDAGARALDVEPEVRAHAAALVVRYRDDAWTWRR